MVRCGGILVQKSRFESLRRTCNRSACSAYAAIFIVSNCFDNCQSLSSIAEDGRMSCIIARWTRRRCCIVRYNYGCCIFLAPRAKRHQDGLDSKLISGQHSALARFINKVRVISYLISQGVLSLTHSREQILSNLVVELVRWN